MTGPQINPLQPDPADPADPYARLAETFPHLTADQVARAMPFGTCQELQNGATLFERGARSVDFFVVLKGCVEIYEHRKNEMRIVTIHRENQFTGELNQFNDRKILVDGRMGEDGEVLVITPRDFRRLLAAEPDIGEIIMRAFILRRTGLISHAQGSVTLIGSRLDGHTVRLEQFLRRNGYPVEVLSDFSGSNCQRLAQTFGLTKSDLPVIALYPGDTILRHPSEYELAEALGLVEEVEDSLYDVAIVGAGPAGLSAAVYASSEGLNTLLLEAVAPGGQAGTSSKIENYLGFPTGISGQALAGRAQVQAQKFGARISLPQTVAALDCRQHPYTLSLERGKTVWTRSIIVASGARYRLLDLPKEDTFKGAGIQYAATALESGLCESEDIIVVGGGNSAGQAAVFLSRYASHVHMLVRGPDLAATMSSYLVDRIKSSSAITLHFYTAIIALEGGSHLEQVTWENSRSGERETRPIRHVFLMLGAVPNTGWLEKCVQLDTKGFIATGGDVSGNHWLLARPPMTLETSRPGVFAIGDVRAGSIKRVASAVGEGSMTISQVHQYLSLAEETVDIQSLRLEKRKTA